MASSSTRQNEDVRSYQDQSDREAYSRGYDGRYGYGFQKNLYRKNSKEWKAYKDGYYDGSDDSGSLGVEYQESLVVEDTSHSAGSVSLVPCGFYPKDADGFDIFWFKNPEKYEASFREWAQHLGFREEVVQSVWKLITTK